MRFYVCVLDNYITTTNVRRYCGDLLLFFPEATSKRFPLIARTAERHPQEALTGVEQEEPRRFQLRLCDREAEIAAAMSESLISNLGKGLKRPSPKPEMTKYGAIGGEMQELFEEAEPDNIDAKEELSREMTKLMQEKINDFKNTTSRIQSILTEDISVDCDVLELAYKYLKISDHKGPGLSRVQKRTLLRKVESLETLARRLNNGQDPISAEVKKGTDMYDLRAHFKGTRGSAEAEARAAARAAHKRKEEEMARKKTGMKSPETALERLAKGGKISKWNKLQKMSHDAAMIKMVNLAKARQDEKNKREKHIKEQIRLRAKESLDFRKVLQHIADNNSTRGVSHGHDLIYSKEHEPPFKLNSVAVLGHVATAIILQEGLHAQKVLKHYMCNKTSVNLFEKVFWACHCKFFQPDSELLLHDIVSDTARAYVRLLNSIEKDSHKTLFFKYYIYAMAHAVAIGYYYHCPGSRNMYDQSQTMWKTEVYMYLSSVLSGMELLPASANIMSMALFNENLEPPKKKRKGVGGNDGGEEEDTNRGSSMAAKLAQLGPKEAGTLRNKVKAKGPTVSLLFSGQALWIPVGNIGKSPGMAANAGTSPMVTQYISGATYESKLHSQRKSRQSLSTLGSESIMPRIASQKSPLSLKRSGPPRKSYRLPTASAKVKEMRETMKDLKAKFKFKQRACNNEIRAGRNELRQSLKQIDDHRSHMLRASIEERQRFTFGVTQAFEKSKKDAGRTV